MMRTEGRAISHLAICIHGKGRTVIGIVIHDSVCVGFSVGTRRVLSLLKATLDMTHET